jgi:diguanylate cyclase (GGDEF)-like protein/PAS domain S-box-containing protein
MTDSVEPGARSAPGDSFYRQLIDTVTDGVYFVDLESRISYWNRTAERITGYSKDEVLGRVCQDTPLRHVDGTGSLLCGERCPLGATCRDGESRRAEVFLHHKAGHRIPVSVRATPIFHRDGMLLGAAEVFSDESSRVEAARRVQELQELAFLDPLTGVGNRRFCDHVLEQRLAEFRRHGWPFGVLFLDIDRFKEVNDAHGHDLGDAVLKTVGRSLTYAVRESDFVGRWGGEEFLVVSVQPGLTGLRAAAERARVVVADSEVRDASGAVRISVSIGATLVRPGDDAESIVRRADSLMFRSKAAGRNLTTLDDSPV